MAMRCSYWHEAVLALSLGMSSMLALACDDEALVMGSPPPGWDADGRRDGRAPVSDDAPAAVDPRLPAEQYGDDASWVFDEDAVREYQLTLEPEQWDALRASALDERYFPAQLSVDGAPFGVVGLRFKGSRGTLGRCADASGNLRCPKLSMKLAFDEYSDARRFFGLKRLNFNSMLSDATELHERLAYELFREMGVVAPRAVHARLEVNGEALGVFSLVEQIDGRFTDDRFGGASGGDGNLYKEQWPVTNSRAILDRTLETNEEAPDHRLMIQFHDELVTASPEALHDIVARYMDTDELLALLAVDRVITNWDGFSSFYCRGGGCYNHNYYFYQHEREDRFSVIPWDLDNTFRLWTPFEPVPSPLARPEDCSPRYPVFGAIAAMAPSCDRILHVVAHLDRERYRDTLSRLLAGPFDFARLDAWLDARIAQLSPYVAKDENGPSLSSFRVAVESLRADLRYLAERAVAEQDGARLPYLRLALDGMNDFEATTPLGLQLGSDRQTAGGSRVIPTIEDTDALDGERDLALAFEFPSSRAEERWARLRLLLDGDIADLNRKTGVRLVLASDAPRDVRIGIDSALYALYQSRAVYGWDVTLDGSQQTIELSFAEAAYPGWGVDALTLGEALSQATALLIEPRVDERRDRGHGGADATDRGRIRIDRIEFTP